MDSMPRICIIGSGASGYTLFNHLSKAKKYELTIIDKKNTYMPNSDFFSWLIAPRKYKLINLTQAVEEQGGKFILAQVERINFKRNKIYFKEENLQPLDYDILVLACSVNSRKLNISGDFRQGVFYFSDLSADSNFLPLVKSSEDIVIYASTFLGIRLANILSLLKKEISLVYQDFSFLADQEEKILNALKEKGISLYPDLQIEELIGDGLLKATRISKPKVIASQIACLDTGFVYNKKIFSEDISVKEGYKTSWENVYCIGQANNPNIANERFFYNHNLTAQNQAIKLANYLIYQTPLEEDTFSCNQANKAEELFWQEVQLVSNST